MKHGFALRSVASPHGFVQVLHFVQVLRVLLGNRMFLLNCCLRHTSSVSQARQVLVGKQIFHLTTNIIQQLLFYVCIDVFEHSKELSLAVAALSVFDLLFC